MWIAVPIKEHFCSEFLESDNSFILSDQNGDLAGHNPFKQVQWNLY